MDRNLSQGLVAGSAFSKSRLEESRLCKSTRSSRRFNALEASTRYDGISRRLVLRTSGSEVIEALETVEADLELLYEVRRESYIIVPKSQSNLMFEPVMIWAFELLLQFMVAGLLFEKSNQKFNFHKPFFKRVDFYQHSDCFYCLG